jgi:hypothetical protein
MNNNDNTVPAIQPTHDKFNPQPLDDHEVDPITGFITYKRFDAFNAPKKLIFLTHYRKTLNMTKASELCGTNRMTVMYHFERDRAFAKAVMQCKLGVADELVETAREVALKDEGVRDRWSLIERLNPDEYGKKDAHSTTEIKITLDGKLLEDAAIRAQALDTSLADDSSLTDGTEGR